MATRDRNNVVAGPGALPPRLGRERRAANKPPSPLQPSNHPFAIPGFRCAPGEAGEVTLLDRDGSMIVRRVSEQGFRKLLREMLSHHLKAELR